MFLFLQEFICSCTETKVLFFLLFLICQKPKVSLTGWKMGDEKSCGVFLFSRIRTWGRWIKGQFSVYSLLLFLLIFVLRLFFYWRFLQPLKDRENKRNTCKFEENYWLSLLMHLEVQHDSNKTFCLILRPAFIFFHFFKFIDISLIWFCVRI